MSAAFSKLLRYYDYCFIVFATPTFKHVDCNDVKGIESSKSYDSCIAVDYVEDRDDDVLLLNRVKNESTVFEGHLLKEKTGVTVTIKNATDPDDIHV